MTKNYFVGISIFLKREIQALPSEVTDFAFIFNRLTFICSKSTTETLEKGVKEVQS